MSAAVDPRRSIAKRIEQLAYRHNTWNVFSDFLELSAISISNAVDPVQRETREARYLDVVKRYTPEELAAFPEMLSDLVEALEGGFDDVLGRLFHDLELHSKYKGQFFSPYPLCRMMAEVTLGDNGAVRERGYVTIMEPACGSGAMLIAAADVLKAGGVNYQQQMHATAIDVDEKCVHMAYLQLSLLGVPAVVIHGNSLALEERSHWRTPMHMLGGWTWRLRRARSTDAPPRAPDTIAEQVHITDDAVDSQLVLL